MKSALVIGSRGTIGQSLVSRLHQSYRVEEISRRHTSYSESELEQLAVNLSTKGKFELIICCIGVLHNEQLAPEKRIEQLEAQRLEHYFRINTIIPALCLRFFHPLLKKDVDSRFVVLSAMVGSISDNQLGGWYGYRSSKAALNMIVKTAAIEISRKNKHASVVAMHPGTTRGSLSKPYASGVSEEKYYAPEVSAERIVLLAEKLGPEDTGQFFNWDGRVLDW